MVQISIIFILAAAAVTAVVALPIPTTPDDKPLPPIPAPSREGSIHTGPGNDKPSDPPDDPLAITTEPRVLPPSPKGSITGPTHTSTVPGNDELLQPPKGTGHQRDASDSSFLNKLNNIRGGMKEKLGLKKSQGEVASGSGSPGVDNPASTSMPSRIGEVFGLSDPKQKTLPSLPPITDSTKGPELFSKGKAWFDSADTVQGRKHDSAHTLGFENKPVQTESKFLTNAKNLFNKGKGDSVANAAKSLPPLPTNEPKSKSGILERTKGVINKAAKLGRKKDVPTDESTPSAEPTPAPKSKRIAEKAKGALNAVKGINLKVTAPKVFQRKKNDK